MKYTAILCSFIAISALAGCGGPGGPGGGGPGGGGFGGGPDRAQRPQITLPEGELSEYQVLGISPFIKISESDIHRELGEPHKFAMHRGGAILLAQSGRDTPDMELMTDLAQYFTVTSMSGVPDGAASIPDSGPGEGQDMDDMQGPGGGFGGGPGMGGPGGGRSKLQTVNNFRLDKALRLAAAKAGADTIVVVWTKSSQKQIPGVRAAVIDADTGKWEIVSPFAAAEDKAAGPEDAKKDMKKPLPELTPGQISAAYKALADILGTKAVD